MGYRVAVVGATGNVGREMMNVLSERKFPADEVFAYMADLRNFAEWDPGVKKVVQIVGDGGNRAQRQQRSSGDRLAEGVTHLCRIVVVLHHGSPRGA